MEKMHIPSKLYKYSSFGANTLRVLTRDQVYYANPRVFNDPLDCNPTIEVDIEATEAAKIFVKMLTDQNGRSEALRRLAGLRQKSRECAEFYGDSNVEAFYLDMLRSELADQLGTEMSRFGVLSLGVKWDCPLMWSHYADHHRGVCIEYSTEEHMCTDIRPICYTKPRLIKLSLLVDWKVNVSHRAADEIRSIYFFNKAKPWKYEHEWRVLNSQVGLEDSPFHIKAIYFGLRCEEVVITAIVKLLANDHRSIKFYRVHAASDVFKLKRALVDTDEQMACGVSSSVLHDLKDML
jgi:hypothetical protein